MNVTSSALINPLVRSGCFALLLAGCSVGIAHADEQVRFFLEDEPIYTSADQESPGVLMEIVTVMTHHLDLRPEVHFLPWKRAQVMARETPNAVIFPLSRTPERESQYLWLCQLFDVPVAFVTLKGTPAADSYEEAKVTRGVGVIIGTPQEERLKAEGVAYITFTGQELYQALADGRVNVIYTAIPEAIVGWRTFGNGRPLEFGEPLQTLPLWIAANKESSRIDPAAWNAALNKVRASGRFDALMQRYFGKEVKW